MRSWLIAAASFAIMAPALAPAAQAAGSTLDTVRARGELVCGIFGSLPGFSAPDTKGTMRGLDADFCRATAAAVLGDAKKVRFVPEATPGDGLSALKDGKIDLLTRNTTVTMSRDTTLGVVAAGVLYYDGAGVLVPSGSGVASIRQLAGKAVCVVNTGGRTTEASLLRFAANAGITLKVVQNADPAESKADLLAGKCDGIAADMSSLAARRVTDFAPASTTRLLPEMLSKEPLGPYVRANDAQWRGIVHWVLNAMQQAEELGVSSTNLVDSMRSSDIGVKFLLGMEGELGKPLGLSNDWALKVVQQVGNYGEAFDRNLGAGSVIGMNRGVNDLWLKGGLLYPLPMR